jgi:bifunctional enzyme CysN/CysC
MTSPGRTIWLTGLSGAGKTTTAQALAKLIGADGAACVVLDGDVLRHGLSHDLSYSAADRDEAVRRAGEVALVLANQGVTVVVALISPRALARRTVRARHADATIPFFEVFINTPLAVCEERDATGLYARARAGEPVHLSGVDDPYETPEHPDFVVSTQGAAPAEVARTIWEVAAGAGERN